MDRGIDRQTDRKRQTGRDREGKDKDTREESVKQLPGYPYIATSDRRRVVHFVCWMFNRIAGWQLTYMSYMRKLLGRLETRLAQNT